MVRGASLPDIAVGGADRIGVSCDIECCQWTARPTGPRCERLQCTENAGALKGNRSLAKPGHESSCNAIDGTAHAIVLIWARVLGKMTIDYAMFWAGCAVASRGRDAPALGTEMLNVLPRPTSDSSSMWPPSASSISRTSDRPRPVPGECRRGIDS